MWHKISETPPPLNIVVLTKIDDEKGMRNMQSLKFDGRLWWSSDGTNYVYYTPTHWAILREVMVESFVY
jgi:hypothetical protein